MGLDPQGKQILFYRIFSKPRKQPFSGTWFQFQSSLLDSTSSVFKVGRGQGCAVGLEIVGESGKDVVKLANEQTELRDIEGD